MIRISATNLEAYRRFLVDEEMELDTLKAYLLKKTEPTHAMLAGTAFHKLLEHANESTLDYADCDGFRFTFDFEGELSLPSIKELKLEKSISIDNEDVVFVGVVDAINGKTVYDHKLTSNENVDNYVDSIQWRAYLDWFEADIFVYNLFIKRKQSLGADPFDISIKSLSEVAFNRYPSMHDDVMSFIKDYIQFVKTYIPELVK